jgi:CheY-like chemotaxis protein/AcrR family transcriptional regulator
MAATRVMVVEDERIVALNIKRRLIQLGYEVPAFVSSGAQALAKIEHARPDVVLMDIHIDGDIDGIETAAQIPRELQIPVIYLTAYSGDETLQRAQATKPDGYLLKPFSERDLHATIQMAIARRAPANTAPVETESTVLTENKAVTESTGVMENTGIMESAAVLTVCKNAHELPTKSSIAEQKLSLHARPSIVALSTEDHDSEASLRWGSGMRSDPTSARTRLLDTALACFRQQGIGNATVTDIAQQAKVTRQTVYRYFDSYSAILKAVTRRELNALWATLHDELAPTSRFGDYLVELLISGLNYAHTEPAKKFLFAPDTLPIVNEILLGDKDYLNLQLKFLQPVYEGFVGRSSSASNLELLAFCEWFNRILASYIEKPSLLFPSEIELRHLLHRWLPVLEIPKVS